MTRNEIFINNLTDWFLFWIRLAINFSANNFNSVNVSKCRVFTFVAIRQSFAPHCLQIFYRRLDAPALCVLLASTQFSAFVSVWVNIWVSREWHKETRMNRFIYKLCAVACNNLSIFIRIVSREKASKTVAFYIWSDSCSRLCVCLIQYF